MNRAFLTNCNTEELQDWGDESQMEERSLTVLSNHFSVGRFSHLDPDRKDTKLYFIELKCKQSKL